MAEKRKNNDTITIKKDDLWKYSTFVLAAVVVILLIVMFAGNPNPQVIRDDTNNDNQLPPAQVNLEIEDTDFVKGNPNAPVVIFEYSDFQCPFCSRFYSETLGQIESQYVESGDVAFVYRHFPLDSIHPEARPSALAAECAGEQGKFWEMHDILFENQQSLSESNYKAWAGELGLNTGQFNNCFDSEKYDSKITAQLQSGADAGVRGTPGFIINGQLVSGAQPFSVFQQIIESELA